MTNPPFTAIITASTARGYSPAPPAPRPVPALRVPVEFAAPDSGTGELTWGQVEIWLAMTRQGWLHMGGTKRLPPGTTVEEIAGELRYLMTRYPSLRSLLRFDGKGRPTQELFASGRIVLEVYDADGDDQAAADRTAELINAHYMTLPRDFTGEWPMRMAVIRRGAALTHMVVQTCHLASDGAGAAVMMREAAVRETAPIVGMQHLELARWQYSEAGQRLHAATARHWEKVLRSLPPSPPPTRPDPREPCHWSGQLDSPALYLALPVIAERTRVASSTVLLALYAIALGRTGVLNPAVVRPLVHNRFRPGVADTFGNLVQSGICVIDVAGIPVDEAVRRTARAALTAYKYAYFDSEKMAALFDEVARERGPHLGVRNFFNDLRAAGPPPGPGATPVTAPPPREAVGASTFHWFEKKENPYEPLFLTIVDAPDSVALNIAADTRRVPPADIEALARTMEAVAVEAALDPRASTGVRAAVPA